MDRRLCCDLAVAAVDAIKGHDVARAHGELRRFVLVPGEMALAPMDMMVLMRILSHGGHIGNAAGQYHDSGNELVRASGINKWWPNL